MADETLPRRKFLVGAGLAGVAAGLTGGSPAPADAQTAPPAAKPTTTTVPETLLTLTATEAAFMSAMADTIIPADELSPSGTDCGVVAFIDRQLAGAYGAGAKMYRSGPYQRGKPEQGYRLALRACDYFAAGIAATNGARPMARISTACRLPSAPPPSRRWRARPSSSIFGDRFSTGAPIVMEGFFSDPMCGNRNKVAWQMLSFPGLPATYAD